jgi:hypothetical protein
VLVNAARDGIYGKGTYQRQGKILPKNPLSHKKNNNSKIGLNFEPETMFVHDHRTIGWFFFFLCSV